MLCEELNASDLVAMIDLDAKLESATRQWPLNEAFAGQFSESQRVVIGMLHKNYSAIALELGIEVSTVRTHMHLAGKAVGAKNSIEFAVMAAKNGMIDLDQITGSIDGLTARGETLLRDHYASTYAEAAEAMGLAVTTIRTHWHRIFEKTGTIGRRQAALVALKTGLIN